MNQSKHSFTDKIVRVFLESNLSIVLIILAIVVGLAAVFMTPREEDPQIVVPLADIYVNFPGHSAKEVEQLVSTPLERILYQIDGVEYVYSMSRENQAIITVRYYVGQDRERSLVKLYKKIDENLDIVPPGVKGWVIKPVEIDDVPIVTLSLVSAKADDTQLRRVAEELTYELSGISDVSRAYVVGGRPRVIHVYINPDKMTAYNVSVQDIISSIKASNIQETAGDFRNKDMLIDVAIGNGFKNAEQLENLVVAIRGNGAFPKDVAAMANYMYSTKPSEEGVIFLKDVARVVDGPAEPVNYVNHGWGAARNIHLHEGAPGTIIGEKAEGKDLSLENAVTIAIAKKKGTNAVSAANEVLSKIETLKKQIVPADMQLIVSRNYGLTANEKVNELMWGLIAAVVIMFALLLIGLGLRESIVVALAIPVVFGLTLAVNMMFGLTINRVTLFALILALGLLVDDPIVDVENISRHFGNARKATRDIVLGAVAEIRPPLIIATLAVIASFLPMFFITGMMGPYMRPMALNVPVTMIMSMIVSFTITPYFAYHMLKKRYNEGNFASSHNEEFNVKNTKLYKFFYPLMEPLLRSKRNSWIFIGVIAFLAMIAMSLALFRAVPLKMLPYDNKNELQLVLKMPEGTTLEKTDSVVRDFEVYLASIPEVVDYIGYAGVASPMDFNGLVRHYYLRNAENYGEIRINLAPKENRSLQSHAIGLRIRDALQKIADRNNCKMTIVETPPGPPVLSSVVAEIYGKSENSYNDLLKASDTVAKRLSKEPGVSDIDNVREIPRIKYVFVADTEKAALNGVSVQDIAQTLETALSGTQAGLAHSSTERNPLSIEVRPPIQYRSDLNDLSKIYVKGNKGQMVPLSELGKWNTSYTDQTIYHKNLQRVAYVFAEAVGRTPAEIVIDVQADKISPQPGKPADFVSDSQPKSTNWRTFANNGSNVKWSVPNNIEVTFSGEGEWNITLDVFRDLGIAFGVAMIAIYILLLIQTKSFIIPLIIMLAIPLTVIGIMPGFWLLNVFGGHLVGGYIDPIYFTATGMIGMIALSGIVTRNAIIIIDFIHLSLLKGNSLFEAIMESSVIRLRPILLTSVTAMLGAAPIIIDPIFSGLAWALIFGLFASTVFTLFIIPLAYYLIYSNKPGHGLPIIKGN
ncbi:MAG TPA: AcrB/AcrD/AcrF family protein [Lentisphaeria bacterium]|nr:MAG: hypothetical protein A2X47_01600 [Lentisphaerae bacterium GWF2_38_69]HBM15750.1 AcrB/AcrD/AcrF family protein [Lentisphaeria bacterium]